MTRQELRERMRVFATAVGEFAWPLVRFPEAEDQVRQLLASTSAIGANYVAAGDGRSRREFKAKLGVSLEEADETVYWLEYFSHHPRAQKTAIPPLLDEARQLAKILGKSWSTLERNDGLDRVRRRPRR